MEKFNLSGKRGVIISAIAVLVVFGAGFWVGYDTKASQVRNDIEKAFTSEDTATERAEAEPMKDLNVEEVKQGETMKFASIDVEFISARSTDQVARSYDAPIFADKGTKFVVVKHKVTNTTKAEFPYEVLSLLDENERIYKYDNDVYGFDDNLSYATLSPSVPKTGEVVYRVPVDARSFTLGGVRGGTDTYVGTKFTVE